MGVGWATGEAKPCTPGTWALVLRVFPRKKISKKARTTRSRTTEAPSRSDL
jgi:hypothetical protein